MRWRRESGVARAYETVEAITRREARNFSYGIRLLPAAKRRALCAVYAMARRIDDIGDGDLPQEVKLARLGQVRRAIRALSDGVVDHTDPVMVALSDAGRRFPIPLGAFDELIEGCEADVRGTTYETFDDLVTYCRCVAGSIGRLSVGVYDPPAADEAMPLADTLGIALQLTNILRDIREDRLTGRIYLPRQELVRFGCSLDVDAAGLLADPAERFGALVGFEAQRAERWYAAGLRLLPLLDRRSAACTAAMAGIYRTLLRRIAADPEPLRSTRLSLPGRQKLAVATRALTRTAA